MSRDQPSSTATASAPSATAPSSVEINSRPDTDPPDPGRRPDPMSLGQSTDMDVSSPENPTQTLILPATAMHPTSPMSSSRVSNLVPIPSPASYKDTLMASDTPKPAEGDVSAPSIEPVTSTPSASDEPFGPWMKVERRQRRVVRKDVNGKQSNPGFVIAQSRFNPIFENETPVEQDILVDRHSPISVTNHSNPIAQVSPKEAVEDPHGKGKASVNSPPVKSRSSLPVRKSVSVQRSYAASTSKSGPLPSRRNSSLSGTRFAPFPRPVPRLNKSNHSAVIISETDAPVFLQGGSFPPLVPDTLLGAIKLPNLEDRQHQPSSLPPLTDGQLQPSPLPALADRQLQPSSLPTLADAQRALLPSIQPRGQ
ncbi:hypothetical protein V6N13_121408 [Hibiscus sabdariffa]